MNVPKLRFKEFTDEWTHCFLSDIAVIQSGLTPSRKIKEYYINGIIPWIKTTDLNNSYITKIEEKISKKALDETSIKIFPKNTLLLAMYGGYNQIGRTGLSTTEITTNQALSAILFKNTDMNSYFFLNLLNKYKDYWKIVSASSRKDPNITKKDVERFPITYPALKEQNKIANFLSTVDKKISNLENIITTLENQKKGLLQQIFNQEIRFKDENGNNYPDWEKKKLGDILKDFYLGGNYKNSTKITKYPLLKMGNLDRGKINLNKIEYIEENEPINERDKIHFGDLFFNTRNTPDLVGKVAIWRNELPLMYFNSNLMKMTFDNNFFMNYKFNTKKVILKLRSIATGTTSVGAIYTKDLLKLELNIPCLEEQTKIADFLSAFDRKIDNQKAQLEHWKQIKKGLLQQMFV